MQTDMYGVMIAVSTRGDGSMLDRTLETHDPDIVERRRRFCATHGVDYGQVVYQRIDYGRDQTYARIERADADDATSRRVEVAADALYTETPGLGLLLPVADCIGTVIYDPVRRALILAHLGRHSTLADLATKTIKYMTARGSLATDLLVWMSPHAQAASYRLEYFDRLDDPAWTSYVDVRDDGYYIDMAGYNHARFEAAGLMAQNITVSDIDTVTHRDYFSHSGGDISGRFAVLVMMH